MSSNKTVTFGIRIPVDTDAASGAQDLETLRKSIQTSQDAVKSYGSSLRALRGNTDEVKAARSQLTAAMNAERESVSRAALAIGRQGATLADAEKKAKAKAKADAEAAKASDSAAAASKSLTQSLLGEVIGGNAAAIAMGGVGAACLAAVAAVVAIDAALVVGAVSLGKWILEGGNALRTMNLVREAALGTAENASNMGRQIEALAGKVPTTVDELNALSVSLSKSLIGARISGQGIVDTFNAVAKESAAMGDAAGKAIEDIITRGKRMGRLQLNPLELQGTGLQFEDVAKNLASQLHIGLAAAKQQLYLGRTDISAGAAAIAAAVDQRFGGNLAARMLDIDVQAKKFRDTMRGLLSGVNLTPVLDGLKSMTEMFDKNTITGKAIKTLLEGIGSVFGKMFIASLPLAKTFFLELIILTLKFANTVLDVRDWAEQVFGAKSLAKVDMTTTSMLAAKVAFYGVAAAIGLAGVATALFGVSMLAIGAIIAAPFVGAYYLIVGLYDAVKYIYDGIVEIDWAYLGNNIIDGIVGGVTSGIAKVKGALMGVVGAIKNTFQGAFDMHSPSKLTEKWGRNLASPIGKGIDAEAPGVQRSMNALAPDAPSIGGRPGGGNASASAGAPMTVTINAHFPNAKNGAEVSATLSGPGFRAQMLQALEELARGMGAPTMTPQGSK